METITNPMGMADYEIIKWLDFFSKSNTSLDYSWRILKSYYIRCKNELLNISEDEPAFSSDNEASSYFSFCKEILKKEAFKKECIDVFGEEYVSYINKILEEFDSNNIVRNHENEWKIAKTIRLYNMFLKLGHSARITYIAMYELDSILNNFEVKNGDNVQLYRNMVVLSALLHDIGRFYQAAHYNTLNDGVMKKNEDKIGEVEVDHAIAGYYYSIASAFELHKLYGSKADDEFLRAKLCLETIAATVVKLHQKSNSKLAHFESDTKKDELNSNSFLDDLYEFIDESYILSENSDYLVSTQIDEKHKDFIDKFILAVDKKLSGEEIDFGVADGFLDGVEVTEIVNTELKELSTSLSKKLDGLNKDNISSTNDYIVEQLLSKVHHISDDELKRFSKLVQDTLEGMLSYDITKAIEEEFMDKNANQNISPIVKFVLFSSLVMTMDADKIDIFNQRALGIYNASYITNSYEIFLTEDLSLIELLNTYFKFNIKKNQNPIIVDSDVLNTLLSSSPVVKRCMNKYISEYSEYIYDSEGKLKSNVELDIYNDKFYLIVDNKKILKDSTELYKMFTDVFYKYLITDCKELLIEEYIKKNKKQSNSDIVDSEKLSFKEFKEKYANIVWLSIKAELFKSNVNKSSEDKVSAYKKVLVSDEMDYRFCFEGENPVGLGWILKLEGKENQHLLNSSISGLIWQLNQFIFTNMRSVHSYKFIRDNHILENIQQRYNEKDPIIGEILIPYLGYANYFINCVIDMYENDQINDLMTGSQLDFIRHKIYYDYLEHYNKTFSQDNSEIANKHKL